MLRLRLRLCSIYLITAEKGGVARAKGGGENEKECQRRLDEKATWALGGGVAPPAPPATSRPVMLQKLETTCQCLRHSCIGESVKEILGLTFF